MQNASFYRLLLASAALALSAGLTEAQVRRPGTAAGRQLPFADHVPTLDVPPPDVATLLEEDLLREAPGPLRYGVPIPIPLDFAEAAAWDLTPDGTKRVGRLRIHAGGAYSIGVEFGEYDLPDDGRVFLYDGDYENVFGAYSQRNRIPHTGELVIEPFPGDTVLIEYSEPVAQGASAEGRPTMVLRSIVYDYKDVLEIESHLNQTKSGDSADGGCNVPVNCPEGDPYPLQKRATVRTLFGGGLCSASLLNNTANDATQFLYTANHCGTGSGVNVRFNYQTPNCGGGGAPTNQSVSGAVLLDADQDTDGRLLRLTETIPAHYNPYYSGWSRSTTNPSFGMSMHHPGGTPKCIAIDTNGGGKGAVFFAGIGTVKVWFMNFHVGGTQPGSSGSPLFDQDLLVRGTLTGGPANCAISDYGRFQNFWNDDDLGEHLDPLETGTLSVGGFDPNDVQPVIGGISPAAVQAFGPGQVTLDGSGFSGAQIVKVGTIELTPPAGFQVPDSSTIEFGAPTPPSLGTFDVQIEAIGGDSNVVSLEYVETSPPKVSTPPFGIGGATFGWNFGGGLDDVYVLIASLDATTFDFGGLDVLLNFQVVDVGFLDGTVGFGSTEITMPSSVSGNTLFSQVLTVDDVTEELEGTNVSGAIIL